MTLDITIACFWKVVTNARRNTIANRTAIAVTSICQARNRNIKLSILFLRLESIFRPPVLTDSH